MQLLSELTRGESTLDLVLTTEDDTVEDVSVGENLKNSNYKMVFFIFKVPDMAAVSHRIWKLDLLRADFQALHAALG